MLGVSLVSGLQSTGLTNCGAAGLFRRSLKSLAIARMTSGFQGCAWQIHGRISLFCTHWHVRVVLMCWWCEVEKAQRGSWANPLWLEIMTAKLWCQLLCSSIITFGPWCHHLLVLWNKLPSQSHLSTWHRIVVVKFKIMMKTLIPWMPLKRQLLAGREKFNCVKPWQSGPPLSYQASKSCKLCRNLDWIDRWFVSGPRFLHALPWTDSVIRNLAGVQDPDAPPLGIMARARRFAIVQLSREDAAEQAEIKRWVAW